MRLGAYDSISKPFNADEVLLAIRKAEERAHILQGYLTALDSLDAVIELIGRKLRARS